ncbi:MAG: zinc ABC transporter substrate-binding protein [Planctomycetia bacterium]|nr:zinc ABC transporter substrate-binding protein [Planctomycetia bacterium]
MSLPKSVLIFTYLTPFLLLLCLAGCRSEVSDPESQPSSSASSEQAEPLIPVLVTVDPLRWIVEQIGGDLVQVSVFVPAGREPETFAPSPRQMSQLADHKVFFRAGLACELPLLAKLNSLAPEMKIVDLRDGLNMLADAHDHAGDVGKRSEHEHEGHEEHCACQGLDGLDPHFWMSPECVRESLQTVTKELSTQRPEKSEVFEANRKATAERLTSLQETIRATVTLMPQRVLLVYHPAYGYFCREFGLEQLSVEVDGKSPKPAALGALIRQIKEKGIKKIIIQPEFSGSSVESILSGSELTAFVHSPLNPDYEANLHELNDFLREEALQNPDSGYNK